MGSILISLLAVQNDICTANHYKVVLLHQCGIGSLESRQYSLIPTGYHGNYYSRVLQLKTCKQNGTISAVYTASSFHTIRMNDGE